jgi:hypothetical protein
MPIIYETFMKVISSGVEKSVGAFGVQCIHVKRNKPESFLLFGNHPERSFKVVVLDGIRRFVLRHPTNSPNHGRRHFRDIRRGYAASAKLELIPG